MFKRLFSSKFFIVLGVLLALSILNPKDASASIGTFELRSTNSNDYRCWAASLIKSNNKYNLAINCVNLVFPANPPKISYYILWATPLSGKSAFKIGDLGKGIGTYEVGRAFSSLFVTLETNAGVKNPSKNIVMNGGVEPIDFLRAETTPTPTPEVEQNQQNPTPAPGTDTSNLSTKDKLLLALKRAGVAAVIALVAIVGLIFVVTRSRG